MKLQQLPWNVLCQICKQHHWSGNRQHMTTLTPLNVDPVKTPVTENHSVVMYPHYARKHPGSRPSVYTYHYYMEQRYLVNYTYTR